MKSTDYKQLKREVEERFNIAVKLAKKQHDEELAALDIVWGMTHKREKRQVSKNENPRIDDSSIGVGTTKDGTTIDESKRSYGDVYATVKKVLDLMPETFNCHQVLSEMNKLSNNKFNYSSVSNRLKRMAQNGIIDFVEEGKGKTPSKYRLKKDHINQLLNIT